MSCNKYDVCQLYFPIPRNGKEQDFILYIFPDNGPQREVMRCEVLQGNYDCINDRGFVWEKLNFTHGLITVPPHVAAQPGKFKYQVAGADEASPWSCPWSPVDKCSAATTTIAYDSTIPMGARNFSEQEENPDESKVHYGVIAGVSTAALVLVLVLVLIYCLYKRNASGYLKVFSSCIIEDIQTTSDPGKHFKTSPNDDKTSSLGVIDSEKGISGHENGSSKILFNDAHLQRS